MLAIKKKVRSALLSRLRADDLYGQHVNTPIQFAHQEWHVNERIIELPFVCSQLAATGQNQRVLEFGCSRSLLAMQLASLGYQVTGVDLRSYPFNHPNFTFYQGNVLDFEESESFDYVTSISVIEHIGLGAYLEEKREDDLENVIIKLHSLLKPTGKLIVTMPVGQAHVNKFFRSFAPDEITELFSRCNMDLEAEYFYHRAAPKVWQPCTKTEIKSVSNHPSDREHTGVNGIGCFVWCKNR